MADPTPTPEPTPTTEVPLSPAEPVVSPAMTVPQQEATGAGTPGLGTPYTAGGESEGSQPVPTGNEITPGEPGGGEVPGDAP